MSKYLLVSFKTCPWVQRAAIVLREKKVDFEFKHISADNRPDWFLAISPHKKVPVLRLDERVSLFESSAIAEYLDETIEPRLHPADPVLRAVNRAWTDFLPTFGTAATSIAYADTKADFDSRVADMPTAFARLEGALGNQGAGPYFNGPAYSLVDAGYAPFLQRHFFLDRLLGLGVIDKFPRLKAWGEALVDRPTTHSFPPDAFEAMYLDTVKKRNKWVSQFVTVPTEAAA